MKHLLEVCLVALTLASNQTRAFAAQPAAPAWENSAFVGTGEGIMDHLRPRLRMNFQTGHSADAAPPLQKGISVQMPVTRNAVPVPDADQSGALIVAVTHNGRIYLRVDPLTPADLKAKLKASLSISAEKKLYVKADARTPYSNVVAVLDAASAADVKFLTLLTSQSGPKQPGARVLPNGLEVRVGPRSQYGRGAAVVNVLRSGQQSSKLTISNKQIPWASLQTALTKLLQNQSKKVVLVNAEGALPFLEVVNVVDVCRSVEAEVVLVTSGQ